MAESIQELLNDAVKEVVVNVRDGEERLAKIMERMEERLDSTLKRIERKVDTLS